MHALWKKTQGWKLPLLGFIGLTFALFSVLGRAEAPPKQPIVTPPVAPFDSSIAGIGVTEPKSELIAIGTELPGVVRQVHVKVGDKVIKGAPLFSIDQRDIDAQVAVLEATLQSTKVQAEDAAQQFKLVENVKDKRAVAQDDYNRRKFAEALSNARVAEIEAQLNALKITKERLNVVAPNDGTILDINIRPGEFAAAGFLSEPLIRMGDLSTLHVRVEIDEENAAHLSENSPAKAYKRGDTLKTYPLTFVRFEPYIAPKQNLAVTGQRVDTRVIQVIYAFPDETKDLFIGQQMDVFIEEKGGEKS
jgi:RND family efflux transporter MFP subunit